MTENEAPPFTDDEPDPEYVDNAPDEPGAPTEPQRDDVKNDPVPETPDDGAGEERL